MPANLPPEAKAKLAKYSDARTPEEKLRALEEFISAVPKHKGTENLLLWARRRMAELREEIEERKRRRVGGGPRIFVEKQGAAQVVILGPPNSGKSSLLAALTRAKPEVAPWPFTTQRPLPGMLHYEDIQFQLVDTPPLILDDPDNSVNSRVLGLARNADALLLVVGLDEENPASALRRLLALLEDRGIYITRTRGLVRIIKSREVNGIRVRGSGRLVGFTEDDLRRFLAEYRVYNAIVEIEGDVTLDDVEAALYKTLTYKPAVILLNKADAPGARERAHKALRAAPPDVPVLAVSALTREGLDGLGRILFERLGIIRVYTKQPNKEPDPEPLILPRGSTVLDAARRIHSRLAKHFRYAKIWGPSAKYPGQRVGGDHVLEDGDIVEIHAS
ncbi:MAG: TGS domain-containing protein [Desulfurococcales archaeon]|nr:TGS domain-containing protein [Desulfurococcales archaeon]